MTQAFLERTSLAAPPEASSVNGVIEVPLLLPERQLEELENAARCQGLTTGQMIRRLIGAFLREPA